MSKMDIQEYKNLLKDYGGEDINKDFTSIFEKNQAILGKTMNAVAQPSFAINKNNAQKQKL